MKDINPIDFYRQQLVILNQEREKIAARKNAIAWGRLAAVTIGIVLFFLLKNSNLLIAIVAAVLCLALFLRLVALATQVSHILENTDRLIKVNQQENATAEGFYHHLPTGAEYLPAAHPYAYDLDIFGRASLFQYLNRTTTQQGSTTLARWLLLPANEEEIILRQTAAKEIAQQPEWRQQLQAYGMSKTITIATQQKIDQWLATEDDYFARPVWKIIRWAGPAAALTILGLYIADVIAYQPFFLCLFVLFLITDLLVKKLLPLIIRSTALPPK